MWSVSKAENRGVTAEVIARIERCMEERGLSQNALAKACGFSQGYVSRLMNGERPDPSVSTVVRIANALGVSLDWLMLGRQGASAPADRYPGLTAALAFARASEDFGDHAALDAAAGIALGMMHDGAEQKGSDEHLRVLRRLYQDALVQRSAAGRAEDAERAAADRETARAKARHTRPALPRRVK